LAESIRERTADQRHSGMEIRAVASHDIGNLAEMAASLQVRPDRHISYLGVAPEHRRKGIGNALIHAGVAELARMGCSVVALTIRERNLGTPSVYRSVGFTEERIICPLRKGFSLP
jgi:ribosomal protein S18 acetylase RimI-like enzyme